MASISQWIAGARPRTLPNAVAPVLAGSTAAAYLDGFCWWRALLALTVALSFVIGVNYANDYSDGVRGTDDERVGPVRLVGAKLATPRAVKLAAFSALGVGALAGLALSLASQPWLIAVGAASIAGAWFYTGGRNPYGYAGFGEIAVFLFFGPVAVLGTQYTQAGRIDFIGIVASIAIGCFSSAVLVTNNLRDIPTDTVSGKNTLAVRLGDSRTRMLFTVLIAVPFLATIAITVAVATWTPMLALLALPLAMKAIAPVRKGRQGPELIAALRDTGLTMLAWALLLAIGLATDVGY